MAKANKKRRIRSALPKNGKTESIRQKIDATSKPAHARRRRVRATAKRALRPLGFLRFLRFIMPPYFRNSWRELKQVTWPSRKETWQLTLAVFLFATIFGLVVAVTDFGLDKVFKRILLNL